MVLISALIHAYLSADVLTIFFGAFGIIFLSIGINKCSLIERIGESSFTIMCIHGPIYRVVVYAIGIVFNQDADLIRNNILLVLIVSAVSVAICLVADHLTHTLWLRIKHYLSIKRGNL